MTQFIPNNTSSPLVNARRERARNRLAERSLRSPDEQVARLDLMLGKGVGAEKERQRLGQEFVRYILDDTADGGTRKMFGWPHASEIDN